MSENYTNIIEAAAYIRVSTEEQSEFSPESQLDRILSYGEKHGYRVKQENIFYDCGISGKSTKKRGGFMAMIEKAKQKPSPFKAVLVWKFSRFARNREDSILYKSMLRKKYGIRVISVSEDIGDDKMSVLIEAMIEAMDEFYSVNLGEEVKRGMTKRAEKGKFQSRVPFGYRLKKGILVPCNEEKEYVKLIFKLFLSGKNGEEISRILNEIGVKTGKGNLWTSRSVMYLLKNPVYAGYVVWDNVKCLGDHLPIISKNNFKQAQTIIENQSRRKKVKNKYSCWFLKFLRCSSCGGKFCICGDGKNLQCINYIKHRCEVSHSISINKIEKALGRVFAEIFSGFDENKLQKKEIKGDIDIDENKLENLLKLKYERAKAAYEAGVYSLEELKNAGESFKNMQKSPLKSKDRDDKTSLSAVEFFNSFLSADKISSDKKEALLSSIIDKIIFYRPNERLVVIFKNGIYNNLLP